MWKLFQFIIFKLYCRYTQPSVTNWYHHSFFFSLHASISNHILYDLWTSKRRKKVKKNKRKTFYDANKAHWKKAFSMTRKKFIDLSRSCILMKHRVNGSRSKEEEKIAMGHRYRIAINLRSSLGDKRSDRKRKKEILDFCVQHVWLWIYAN